MTAAISQPVASSGAPEGRDFSLVLGGPTFQLLRRTRLTDERLGLLPRRILLVILITWAPLVALTALEGSLLGPRHALPFFHQIGVQLRFLIVAPLLIAAELLVHRRMQPIMDQFRARRLVPPDETAHFADALGRAMKLRNSAVAEAILLGAVYAGGIFITMGRYAARGGDAWYASSSEPGRLSLAGMWFVFVSLPVLQFLLLRWYFRLLIWTQCLWRVSRLDLNLNATHPDKAGGLGFLAGSLAAFAPLAMAHGVLFTGVLADRIFHEGARLTDFPLEVFEGAVLLIVLFAGPLTVFAPQLARVRRVGLREYGALGQDYVRAFRDKWMAGGPPPDEPLVGSGDIQSLADLGNSYAGAEQMRIVPIGPIGLVILLGAFLVPMAPLLLTMMSATDLVGRIVGVVF